MRSDKARRQRRRSALLVGVATLAVMVPSPVTRAQAATTCQPLTTTGPLPVVTAADAGRVVMAALPGPTLDTATARLIRQRRLGGVLLFGRSVRTRAQLGALDAAIHRAAGAGRIVIATDQEGGTVRRVAFAGPRPSARSQAPLGTTRLRSLWASAGRQLRAVGIDLDLAPVADLGLPGSFEGTRTFAATPGVVGPLVAAATRGLRDGRVGATAKHFPGLGGTRRSTDDAVVRGRPVTDAALRPFRAAVAAGVPVVMVDLAVHPGLGSRPAALAAPAYALLRRELHFRGVAMTDALDAVAARKVGSEAQTAVAALCAGADMVIAPGPPATATSVIDAIAAAVRSGRLPHARFAEAVARVDRLARHPAAAP